VIVNHDWVDWATTRREYIWNQDDKMTGQVIEVDFKANRSSRPTRHEAGSAQIIMFTGVRFEPLAARASAAHRLLNISMLSYAFAEDVEN
jgi:hypothetical protein